MPDSVARGLPRGSVSGSGTKTTDPPSRPRLTFGLTLDLEEGDLDADFCYLGVTTLSFQLRRNINQTGYPNSVLKE